jgi:hypothetical protein
MSVDCGGAPCATARMLSLAICKPQIRCRAAQGSLIFGFQANHPPMFNRLIYVAKVTDPPLFGGEYYRNYLDRPDCIYRWGSDAKLTWKRGSQFHENGSEAETDIGLPPDYPKAVILLSRDFRYFGREGTADYALSFPLIGGLIRTQGRYYLVNHVAAVRRDLLRLKHRLWREFTRMRIGMPTTEFTARPCNTAVGPICVC